MKSTIQIALIVAALSLPTFAKKHKAEPTADPAPSYTLTGEIAVTLQAVNAEAHVDGADAYCYVGEASVTCSHLPSTVTVTLADGTKPGAFVMSGDPAHNLLTDFVRMHPAGGSMKFQYRIASAGSYCVSGETCYRQFPQLAGR